MSYHDHSKHDRYTRVTVTLVAAGVWALAAAVLALPAPSGGTPEEPGAGPVAGPGIAGLPAGDTATAAVPAGLETALPAGHLAPAPVPVALETAPPVSGSAATLPLRWILPWARNQAANDPGDLECLTLLRVVPLPGVSAEVEVEFFDSASGLDGATVSLSGLVGNVQVVSDLPFSPDPVFSSGSFVANTGFLVGSARVYADDPRILVAPYLICEDSADGSVDVLTRLDAFPMGPTLDFFQADLGRSEPDRAVHDLGAEE